MTYKETMETGHLIWVLKVQMLLMHIMDVRTFKYIQKNWSDLGPPSQGK